MKLKYCPFCGDELEYRQEDIGIVVYCSCPPDMLSDKEVQK